MYTVPTVRKAKMFMSFFFFLLSCITEENDIEKLSEFYLTATIAEKVIFAKIGLNRTKLMSRLLHCATHWTFLITGQQKASVCF